MTRKTSVLRRVAKIFGLNSLVKGKAEVATLYRHWRYVKDGERHPAITFKFIINQNNNTLRFSYAICNKEDNFSYEAGRKIADARMTGGKYIVMDYNRAYSLVENAYAGVYEALNVVDGVFMKVAPTPKTMEALDLKTALAVLHKELKAVFCYTAAIGLRNQADELMPRNFMKALTFGILPQKFSGGLHVTKPNMIKVYNNHTDIQNGHMYESAGE